MGLGIYQATVRSEVNELLSNLGTLEPYDLSLFEGRCLFTLESGEIVILESKLISSEVLGVDQFFKGDISPVYVIIHSNPEITTFKTLVRLIKTISLFIDEESLRVKALHDIKQKAIFAVYYDLVMSIKLPTFTHLEQLCIKCLDLGNGLYRKIGLGMIDGEEVFLIQRSRFNRK